MLRNGRFLTSEPAVQTFTGPVAFVRRRAAPRCTARAHHDPEMLCIRSSLLPPLSSTRCRDAPQTAPSSGGRTGVRRSPCRRAEAPYNRNFASPPVGGFAVSESNAPGFHSHSRRLYRNTNPVLPERSSTLLSRYRLANNTRFFSQSRRRASLSASPPEIVWPCWQFNSLAGHHSCLLPIDSVRASHRAVPALVERAAAAAVAHEPRACA